MSDLYERTAAAMAFRGVPIGNAEREANERLEGVAAQAEKEAGVDALRAEIKGLSADTTPDSDLLAKARRYADARSTIAAREIERSRPPIPWTPPQPPAPIAVSEKVSADATDAAPVT